MIRKKLVPILCLILLVGMTIGCVEEEQTTNEAPVAGFTAPETIYVNVEVTFSDASTDDNEVVSWSWDFDGDGEEDSSDTSPTYTFTETGEYTVTLIVKDADGESGEYFETVTVMYMPPTAAFTYDPMINITTSTEIIFTDNSTKGDFNITAWEWDFGDGNTSNETNPTHTYAVASNYTVTLTVTDANEGTDASEEVIIEVLEAG